MADDVLCLDVDRRQIEIVSEIENRGMFNCFTFKKYSHLAASTLDSTFKKLFGWLAFKKIFIWLAFKKLFIWLIFLRNYLSDSLLRNWKSERSREEKTLPFSFSSQTTQQNKNTRSNLATT